VELDAISQPPLELIERVQGADLVVGVLGAGGNALPAATGAKVREAVGRFAHPLRALLVVDDGAGGPRIEEEQSLPVLFCKLSDQNGAEASPQAIFHAYQTIFEVSGQIGARACGVIASAWQAVTPQWIDRLVRPALEMEFDLVAPRYARHKWEGLLNRSILSPLSRALYGRRIQNPMGPDFGLSSKLMQRILESHGGPGHGSPSLPGASITSVAVCDNFQICEAWVGARRQPPADWMNLSSLVAELLGPVFLDMERNAAVWQRVRGSQPAPVFGEPEFGSAD